MFQKLLLIAGIFLFMASPSWAASVPSPEFDGVYAVTTKGKLIELSSVRYYSTVIYKGNIAINQLLNMTKSPTYYMMDVSNAVQIKRSEFKGIAVRGNAKYPFKHFTCHPVLKTKLDGVNLIENKGPAESGSVIYVPGKKLEERSKTLPEDSFYAEMKEPLKAGLYTAWPGTMFLFELID